MNTHLLTPDKESVVDQRRIPPKTDLVTCGNMGEALFIRTEMAQQFYTKAHPSMKTGNLIYATQSVDSLIVGKTSFPGC